MPATSRNPRAIRWQRWLSIGCPHLFGIRCFSGANHGVFMTDNCTANKTGHVKKFLHCHPLQTIKTCYRNVLTRRLLHMLPARPETFCSGNARKALRRLFLTKANLRQKQRLESAAIIYLRNGQRVKRNLNKKPFGTNDCNAALIGDRLSRKCAGFCRLVQHYNSSPFITNLSE